MPEPGNPTATALRAALEAGQNRLHSDLLAGESGILACARMADVCDGLVLSLLAGSADGRHAVIATGGWGRREMCPQSDLDLLLVGPPGAAPLADEILYPLWDAGVRVGHSVRDVKAIEDLARSDVKTATALLDARLLAGPRSVFEDVVHARDRAIAPGGDPTRFVRQLTDERDRRHRRFGDSIYLLEPNIKQGIGALRDLMTAIWVAQVRFGAVGALDLVKSGQLTARQANVLHSSRDFFLRVRSLVQAHTGRASDQLTFEVQEAISPVLYPNAESSPLKAAVAPAVEALMRAYYLHASGVTQVMAQLFEAALTRSRSRPTIVRVDGSFLIFSGKLSVADASVFDDRPGEMMRAFGVARELAVPIHWHTRELIAERALTGDGVDLTADAGATAGFVDALVAIGDVAKPTFLEEMHRVGLIASVIPEFRACTGRVQHDLYHVYTVDQHQLYAVNMLKRIARGEAEEHQRASEVYAEIEDTRALYLATLLHDVGKPLGKGHSESGAKIARASALRFGFAEGDADRAALLVRNHLTMSHVSQRRDLSDAAVIRRFADRVGDPMTLRELFLLTLCDTAMTAPGNLTPWKTELLFELYGRTQALFAGTGEAGASGSSELTRTRERAAEILAEQGIADASALCDGANDHLASVLSPRQLARLLALVGESAPPAAFAASLRAFPLKGHSEIALVASDRSGLLAAVTGALAICGISVEGAVIGQVLFGEESLAADLFFVRGPDGAFGPTEARWFRFEKELAAILDEGSAVTVGQRLEARRRGNLVARVLPSVPTEIGFAEGASEHYSVLEVFTEDRIGLLSDIASCLVAQGLDIHLAKISTEGQRATDVFYVVDAANRRPLDAVRQEIVAGALRELFK